MVICLKWFLRVIAVWWTTNFWRGAFSDHLHKLTAHLWDIKHLLHSPVFNPQPESCDFNKAILFWLRRTLALLNLFQVIWRDLWAGMKLREICELPGPRDMRWGWEVHTAMFLGKQALGLLDMLCPCPEADTLLAPSPLSRVLLNPSKNGGKKGLRVCNSNKFFTLSRTYTLNVL